MTTKLIMKLLVEGVEKQKLEAELSPYLDMTNIFSRKIIGLPKISGENHINPEEFKDVETAYKGFEGIRTLDYPNKKASISLDYI